MTFNEYKINEPYTNCKMTDIVIGNLFMIRHLSCTKAFFFNAGLNEF